MFNLTTAGAADLVLAFGYALGIVLLLRAVGKGGGGSKVLGLAIIPALAGLFLIVMLLAAFWKDSLGIFRLSVHGMAFPLSLAAIIAAVLGAVAVADLALNHVTRIAGAIINYIVSAITRSSFPRQWPRDVALALALTVTVGAAFW
ncbi:MAG: hypothetical protein FJ316_05000 [SAR202 cluster bacterium]|nr:hypothetical protein [SAR202 cluster bacterium]